jgi:CRISPR-associated protein Cas5t
MGSVDEGMSVRTVRTLFLRIEAPFAAFRWLQAGVYRGTFPVIPPSAAWGLALNLAGIETRGPLNEPVTSIRPDAPHLWIAVGALRAGQRSTLYQQLHTYPVGSAGKELKPRTHGAKYWIAPAKRELLVGLSCVVGVRGEATVVDRIPDGLRGVLEGPRYGLPFAGDNQFLFDRIDVVDVPGDARWYVPLGGGESRKETTRLTTNIHRGDASRTVTPLFAPTSPQACPGVAWVDVGPSG